MSGTPLIKIAKYVTQVGQLKRTTRNVTGDTVVSTIVTVNCLVYQDDEQQEVTNPAMTKSVRDFAVIASTVATSLNDHLANVVDQFGNPVLTDARIVKVTDYNHWKYGPRFKKLDLDVDLV